MKKTPGRAYWMTIYPKELANDDNVHCLGVKTAILYPKGMIQRVEMKI